MASKPKTFRPNFPTSTKSKKRLNSSRWQKLRRQVLRRDPICKWPGCTQPSNHCDHIVPYEQGGKDEMKNLQGLCPSHHSKKTNMEQDGVKFKTMTTTIFLYPPFGDQSSLLELIQPDDLVWDSPTVMAAITETDDSDLYSLAAALRHRFAEWIQFNNLNRNVWIFLTNPQQAKLILDILPNADLLCPTDDQTTCENRCKSLHEVMHVRDWFEKYGDAFKELQREMRYAETE